MTDDELEAIRAYAERHGVKPWTEHIFTLLADREELVAEVFRLRALVGEPEWEYGVHHVGWDESSVWRLHEDRPSAERDFASCGMNCDVARRRPGREPGPWEPVPETGDDQ